jgi:hypothetical protein
VPAAISTHGPGGNAITAAVVIDFDGTADTGRVSRVTSIRAPSTPLWRACSRRRRRHQVSVVGARPCSVQNARTLWPLASCRASHCACSAALTLPRARDPLVARIGGALAIIVSMSHRSRHQLAATTLYSVGHLRSSTALVKELKLDGVTSKAWTTQDGKTRDGRPIDKGHIYKLLSNRTYLGELRHKDQWYQAEHPPIVSRELWDSVHVILATNGRVRGNTTRAKVPYLLKGIVFGNDGRALSPWHTTKKNGRRYRYYVPQRDAKEHAGASGLPRLPAAELESAVLDQLRAILRAPNLLGDMLPQAIKLDPTLDEAKITVAMTRLDAIWDQLFPAEQTRIVKLLVEKVIVSPNDLEVRLRANGIERLVLELRPEPVEQQVEALA